MQDSENQDSIPIISIKSFRKGQLAGRDELLFNELHGERHIDKPHKHDFFVIILFDKASGTHNIDSKDYPIDNKEIHILFPGQMHKWQINDGTIGYQLMTERSFFEQFAPYFRFSFTNYQNHPVIKLSDEAFSKLMYEFNAIKEELKSENSLVHLINARAAVIAAIVSKEAEQIFTEFKVYQSNPRLAKFNMLIDEFYKEEKSVVFYAEKLHISANYLNILCKKHLKVSATQLIQQRIIIEAKRLLKSGDLSIKEIAFELGFTDHAYFSNFFKAQTDLTPSEFRNP
ncbi:MULTISPECIES: helix-turn-helix transcriptional regulator [unclassified Empedobacter]|uniref:helix-turn-helix domain-containing protein n=1 Tax=unclassified Empedobacter TaxID=2643773 RepID=UPI002447D7B9|nr:MULTISPECIES: helix-turn-helix transcriptional regulator [unclassified Empedobacter]MDH0659361.1 AraC family transcriptional regulator [Empedobacter sp. GD03865]MDH0674327.1 AraC family transcriptional regulator [Empedobacter sp. GD03861]